MGEYLRQRRTEVGVSQRELAERLGSTQPAIARLEAGGVAVGTVTLGRIAEALGYDLELVMVDRTSALRKGVPFKFGSRVG
jgi:transcriptional regulator with XRE-family HTH domain